MKISTPGPTWAWVARPILSEEIREKIREMIRKRSRKRSREKISVSDPGYGVCKIR
jgi:hypothetical protein